MQRDLSQVSLWTLAGAACAALTLSSCTTTSSNLTTALSASNHSNQPSTVERSAPIQLKTEETTDVAATAADLKPEAPAIPEPVAQPRPTTPVEPTSKPPVVLTSVPRTSVKSQPTNQIMMIRTTAYSHLQTDSLPYGRKSAAGGNLQYGSQVRSAAADWSKYPLGTKFKIEGLPYTYVVDDYGSALCGTETIDIYKPDLAGIGNWGVRNLPVRVLEWGSYEESRKILDSRKHVKHAHHVRTMLHEIEKKTASDIPTKVDGGSA